MMIPIIKKIGGVDQELVYSDISIEHILQYLPIITLHTASVIVSAEHSMKYFLPLKEYSAEAVTKLLLSSKKLMLM